MSTCYKKLKGHCIQLENCYWIKGKGCYRKDYKLPQWKELLSKQYSLHEEQLPLHSGKERTTLSDLGLLWLEKKYSSYKQEVCVWGGKSKMTSKFTWIDISNIDDKELTKYPNDKKIQLTLKMLDGALEKLFIPESLTQRLQECLTNRSNVIIIPLTMKVLRPEETTFKQLSFHRNIIIINKFLKTIELYDPNGGAFHEYFYDNKELPYLKKYFKSFPELKRYRFEKTSDIWEYGFQHYESETVSQLNEKGRCIFWAIFLAELRIKYYNIPPKELIDHLMSQLKEGHEPALLTPFIKEYINYLKKQLDPEHSVHLYSILTKSAKNVHNIVLKKDYKHKPLWHKDRNLEYNRIVDLSILYLKTIRDVCVPFIPTNCKASDKLLMWIDLRLLPDKHIEELKESKHILLELTRNKGYGLHIPHEIREMILDCLKTPTKLVIIPLSYVRGKTTPTVMISGHKCLMIVNHVLKTIEFYDPNGARAHVKMFGEYDIHALKRFIKSFPTLKGYTIYDYTSLKYEGFQHYEAMFTDIQTGDRGKCAFWASFIANLRAKYYYLTPEKLITQIYDKIDEANRPEVFKKFILDYMTYMDRKLGSKI